MERADRVARICRVLGVEARVRIVQMLKQQVLCVGALAARLDITQGAVSQHLRILRDAGLVTAQKRGYFVHYKINTETFQEWEDVLGELLSTTTSEAEGAEPCAKRKDAAARSRKS
jgi:ArsR family transcriptional regulator